MDLTKAVCTWYFFFFLSSDLQDKLQQSLTLVSLVWHHPGHTCDLTSKRDKKKASPTLQNVFKN